MDDQQPASQANPPTDSVEATPSDKVAWTVKFEVPTPPGMPADRLKARAELVRAAGGCCDCGSSY